MYSYEFGQKL